MSTCMQFSYGSSVSWFLCRLSEKLVSANLLLNAPHFSSRRNYERYECASTVYVTFLHNNVIRIWKIRGTYTLLCVYRVCVYQSPQYVMTGQNLQKESYSFLHVHVTNSGIFAFVLVYSHQLNLYVDVDSRDIFTFKMFRCLTLPSRRIMSRPCVKHAWSRSVYHQRNLNFASVVGESNSIADYTNDIELIFVLVSGFWILPLFSLITISFFG